MLLSSTLRDSPRLAAGPVPWYSDRLACPACGSPSLDFGAGHCPECFFSTDRPRDLRPTRARTSPVALSTRVGFDPDAALARLVTEPPPNTYGGPRPMRDSGQFLSIMNRRLRPGDAVLDLGCGPRDQAAPIEHLGFRYVGIDYINDAADLLADAHSLPFRDASFDGVLSYAVFQHLYDPFLALREVDRVLRPGGAFLGAVSQGEPFMASYFHFTAWGLLSMIAAVPSLRVVRMWGSMDTLRSLSRIGRYPRVIRSMLAKVELLHRAMPWLAPGRCRWSAKDWQLDHLFRAGSICFEIEKLPT